MPLYLPKLKTVSIGWSYNSQPTLGHLRKKGNNAIKNYISTISMNWNYLGQIRTYGYHTYQWL